MAYRRPNRNIKLFGGAISARTQRIRDKEDDGATNRRDPKEEHIQGKHKVWRAVLYAYLLVI
jgi:hypothetical protein